MYEINLLFFTAHAYIYLYCLISKTLPQLDFPALTRARIITVRLPNEAPIAKRHWWCMFGVWMSAGRNSDEGANSLNMRGEVKTYLWTTFFLVTLRTE